MKIIKCVNGLELKRFGKETEIQIAQPGFSRIDTKNREYLTSKVNSLFLAKSQFIRTSGGTNKNSPPFPMGSPL